MKKFNYNDLETDVRLAISSTINSLKEKHLDIDYYDVTIRTIGSSGTIDPCDFSSYVVIKFLAKLEA